MFEQRWWRSVVGPGAISLLLLLAGTLGSSVYGGMEQTLTVFMISLVAVLGIGVFSGNSGILSFGHVAFMGLAAYLSGILTMPVSAKQVTLPNLPEFLGSIQLGFHTSLIVTVFVVTLVGALVGAVICRLEGAAAVIATLGLLVIVHGLIIGARDITRGSQSFFGVPRETDLWTTVIAAVIAVVLSRVFRDSVVGLRLRASREDGMAALAIGVNIHRHRWVAWTLSVALVALSGALLGHFLGAFSAKKFYFSDTFALLAMLIVGGMSTVTGAVAGAAAISGLIEVLRRLESGFVVFGFQMPEMFGLTQIGLGILILAVMYGRRGGLIERLEWDEWLLKPIARRPVAGEGSPDATDRKHAKEIEGRAIRKSFGGLVAVDGVTIKLRQGEIVGLIGPNGSGKTTLLNLLSGLATASGGDILVAGTRVNGKSPEQFARYGIGRTFQNIRLFRQLSVHQNVLAAALINWPASSRARSEERAASAIAAMSVSDMAHRTAETLAYGSQRRVEIARALALNPSFLFLDEPAAGMNREETDALVEDLRKLRDIHNLGILVVDHDLPLINRLCDRVVALNEGRVIAEGKPADVQRDHAVVEAYLGRRHKDELSRMDA